MRGRLLAGAIAGLALAAALPAGALGSSPLHWRGIVEGAYGPSWSHAERIRVLRWMPSHGFDAYVHAPKNDVYQRTNWRDPYPAAEQSAFDREIRLARRLGVQWIPNLSPAQAEIPTPSLPNRPPSRDLCFSCAADLRVVAGKLQPFIDAGSRTVMISFDDVTKVMTHPEDLGRYGTGSRAFGEANGDFLTRLLARLRQTHPSIRLLTVGADYSGTADTDYLRGLRATLAPGIGVMWTGTNIPSEHWRPADAHAYGKLIGRRPLVWDNWTDDDTAGNATPAGTARLFLGPYTREPATARAVGGFFFNPANEADLNFLPLATAGAWMDHPGSYRPRHAWRAAIRELAPGSRRRARARRHSLRAWAEASWSNKLDRERSDPTFQRRADAFLAAYEKGARWPSPGRRLLRELTLVARAPTRLKRLPDRAIAAEAGEFLDAGAQSARDGRLAAKLLAAERPALRVTADHGGYRGLAAPPDPAAAAALRSDLAVADQNARASSEFVYGWRTPFAFDIPPYPVPGNAMDAFVDAARDDDASWVPSESLAASSVRVALAGKPVALDGSGRFRLRGTACGKRLIATDGDGGTTGLTVPGC